MDRELNANELENVLGGANPKAVEERLQNGYTETFRDKVLSAKLGETPTREQDYNGSFRDKFLEDKIHETDEEERCHKR